MKTMISEHLITPSIRAIDLFCGVGGLTHGLIRGGIDVRYGVDLDPQCRFPFESNNHASFIQKDVQNVTSDELLRLFGDAELRLIAGCAPCQPFSTYSQKGRNERIDEKWELVAEFGRLVYDVQPEFVTMENVAQLRDHTVFKEFVDRLKGYAVWHNVVNCADYGIPQTRKRLVLLASRLGPIELVSPPQEERRIVTVRDAISRLSSLAAGTSDVSDPLHTACSLSDLNLRRIRASKPGGTWRDWDDELVAQCHRKHSGQTYPSVYGRMEWDAPAPTITTQCFGFGNGRFGHPEQDRAISLREAAILQTFPDNYQFLAPGEKVSFAQLGRLIGNAVPVRIGEVVAQSIVQHVQKYLHT